MFVRVSGQVAKGFEPVADAFRANFEEHGEVGAAFSVWHHDELVVDLWAGVTDRDTKQPWERDTLAVVFSATKGLVALAFLMLEDRGELDVDVPVGTYWPAFGADPAKADINVRTLLNHRAGLSAVDAPLTIEDILDHDKIEDALVRQVPMWKPGSAQGYGATAWGLYAGTLFRKITGETVGTWLKREVFDPLGVDVHLGLPAALHERVATTYPVAPSELLTTVLPKIVRGIGTEGKVFRGLLFDKGSDTQRAFLNPSLGEGRLNRVNEASVQALELPWMNACASAAGLAEIYSAVVSGRRLGRRALVKKAALERIATRQSWAYEDRVLHKPLGFSQGFVKDEPTLFSPHEAAFGHPGAGGAFAFADPVEGIAMAYVMNRMDHHIRSPRAIALARSVYTSLHSWS